MILRKPQKTFLRILINIKYGWLCSITSTYAIAARQTWNFSQIPQLNHDEISKTYIIGKKGKKSGFSLRS